MTSKERDQKRLLRKKAREAKAAGLGRARVAQGERRDLFSKGASATSSQGKPSAGMLRARKKVAATSGTGKNSTGKSKTAGHPVSPAQEQYVKKASPTTPKSKDTPPKVKKSTSTLSPFGRQFKAARDAGKKEFTYTGPGPRKGKLFHTRHKGEKASAPPAKKGSSSPVEKGSSSWDDFTSFLGFKKGGGVVKPRGWGKARFRGK
jgi:hypothetical protein